ncbi:MAG TPA: hypothetical protein VLU25_04900 [Acidobacteriota bacterium]|nr:hypothetical protein [Acidobacteriota bacterium]
MFKRLFGRGADDSKDSGAEGSFHRLGWVAAENNDYGVRMLDCRSYTRSVPANSDNPSVAARFLRLRQAQSSDFQGRTPHEAVSIDCDLSFPPRQASTGPIHRARVMEDKWDVYQVGNDWCFIANWSGEPVFILSTEEDKEGVRATRLQACLDMAGGDETLALRQADYLAKHYIYDWGGPLPLPQGFPEQPRQIAEYAFEHYGRRASFATFEDTLPLRP